MHAWVIMGNHYHLFIETPEANLVEGMKWLQNTYTRRFNVRHRAWGRVFGDRYKCVVVEGELPEYYGSLVDYIHLNPARAAIVSGRRGESLLDYRWSSLAEGYALPVGKRRSGWPPMWGWKDWDTAIRRRVGGRWWRTWTGAHWRRDAKAVWCRCPLR